MLGARDRTLGCLTNRLCYLQSLRALPRQFTAQHNNLLLSVSKEHTQLARQPHDEESTHAVLKAIVLQSTAAAAPRPTLTGPV